MSNRKGMVPSRKGGSPRFVGEGIVEAPVTTYRLSEEELEELRGGKHIPTIEEYHQLREAGKKQKEIQELWGWNHNQMASFMARHKLGNRYKWPQNAKHEFGRAPIY